MDRQSTLLTVIVWNWLTVGCVRACAAGSNPQLDRLRQCSDVHVSLDDEEMREVDPDEHRETLGAGIPQHLGHNLYYYLLLAS